MVLVNYGKYQLFIKRNEINFWTFFFIFLGQFCYQLLASWIGEDVYFSCGVVHKWHYAILNSFWHPLPPSHTFHYSAFLLFLIIITKSLTPYPPKAVTSWMTITFGQSCDKILAYMIFGLFIYDFSYLRTFTKKYFLPILPVIFGKFSIIYRFTGKFKTR